jgi:hypothetical protein
MKSCGSRIRGIDVLRQLLGLIVLAMHQAAAAPPADGKVDPALSAWFKALKQPGTSLSCCSIADCRFASAVVNGDHFEVNIEGQHLVVPDARIIGGISGPDGRAVVCYTYAEFRPPAPLGTIDPEPQDRMPTI